MRVTNQDEGCEKLMVFLDGIDVSEVCTMADDELGEVELYCRDEEGRFVENDARDGIKRETRHGEVRIRERL